jgi:hypothetical protein
MTVVCILRLPTQGVSVLLPIRPLTQSTDFHKSCCWHLATIAHCTLLSCRTLSIRKGCQPNFRDVSCTVFVYLFIIPASFYLTIVGIGGYCCTWSRSDTLTLGRTPLDEWSARRRGLLYQQQHAPLTRDRDQCPRRDSNPQSQQVSCTNSTKCEARCDLT